MSIKILLADDHPLTRAGIAEFLKRESSFELVAEAEDGIKAWEQIQALKPDIALLDIRMPGMDGVAVAQKVKAEGLQTSTIMLTSYDAQQYVMASLRAGARGFVLKTVSPRELTTAINAVAKGGLYLDAQRLSALLPSKNVKSAVELLPYPFQKMLEPFTDAELYLSESALWNHLYDKALRLFRDFDRPSLSIVAFPFLLRFETQNVSRIYEGVRFGIPARDLKDMMIGAHL